MKRRVLIDIREHVVEAFDNQTVGICSNWLDRKRSARYKVPDTRLRNFKAYAGSWQIRTAGVVQKISAMSSAAVHGSDHGKTLLSGREVDQGNSLIFALLNERLVKIKYAFSELSVLVQYGWSALKHDRITDFPRPSGDGMQKQASQECASP